MQDDVIGIVEIKHNESHTSKMTSGKVYHSQSNNSFVCFDKACLKELNCERIFFDRNFFTSREGTICDNKTHKLNGSRITIDLLDNEEAVGQYEMVKEANGYKLYKI